MCAPSRAPLVFAAVAALLAPGASAQGPDFDLRIVAQVGDAVSNGGTLTTLDPYTSINDKEWIAFSGVDSQGSKTFVIENGTIRGITFFSAGRVFNGAAINNNAVPLVATRDRVTGSPPVYLERTWPGDGSQLWTLVGKSPDDFDSGLLFVDVNDSGVMAFSGLDTSAATQTLLFAGAGQPPTELATYNGNISVRPQISNNHLVVIRDDANTILAWPYPAGAPIVYGGAGSGFTAVGRQPGISPDGSVGAFEGDRGSGEGIFVSVAATAGQHLIAVTGEGQDGFTGFQEDERVGVITHGSLATGQAITTAFVGTRNGTLGVYARTLTATENGGVVNVVRGPIQSVARVGDTAKAAGGTTKTIAGVSLYDPLNAFGTVVLWASFSDASHGIVRGHGDRDGDGLLDVWETSGVDVNFDGTVDYDLAALGADPDHKDLFVEIDAMAGRAPAAATIDLVVAAFAQAPNALVQNPDGQPGVALHYDIDETTIPLAPWPNDFVDFDAVKTTNFGTAAERADANWTQIKEAKRLTHRYVIFADQRAGGDSSGRGELPGNDCMVTLGHPNWGLNGGTIGGTPFQQAGTFMHEFGHTLGLRHGGADNTHYKPNYHSVMSYTWQLPGGANNANWSLVYSAEPFADLDESSLDESVGVGGPFLHHQHATLVGPPNAVTGMPGLAMEHGPIDWNGDGDKTDMGVARDLNHLYSSDAASAGDALNISSHLDWSSIVYNFRDSADFADGVHVTGDPTSELTATRFQEQLAACPDSTTYCTTKANSLGCVPAISLTGSTSLSGPDDLHVDVTNVRSQRYGVLAWSRTPDELPFLGGTLCLSQPMLRGPVGFSNGNQSDDCSGSYSFHLPVAYLVAQTLAPGDLFYCQVWSRDSTSSDPTGISLTEGLVFAICQ